MPRQEGLRPIGESVKKIIEKIKKEREERQKKSSSPRTQPKLPGMKKGGGADASIPTAKEYANILKDKDKVTESDMERARKRLSTETGRKVARFQMNKQKQRIETKKADDKVKASLREISARGMKIGGSIERVPGGYAKEGSGRISDKGLKGQSPQKVFADKEKRMENVKSFGMKKKMMKGGEAKRPRRERDKQGLPPKPTTKPTRPKPMMPPIKKKKDSGYDKTKNQPRQDAGVEYDKGGPSRPGKNITGYTLKKGGLTGGQKKLDANKDGKISGEDFKILKGKNNKMKGGGIAIKGTNFKGVF
jgi:hypothetical protein